jgi:hypothetical protein
MTQGWRTVLVVVSVSVSLLSPITARGDIVVNGSFGPNGDVGFVTSPPNLSITFGVQSMGSIYQMDGFVNAPGQDLGSGPGVSADLANGSPTGIGYTFGESQPTAHQLLLNYNFTNNTGVALPGFQFLYFVDPDIGPNFADETATLKGTLGTPSPSSFQIGDPSLSSIFTNLLAGTLNNVNGLPPGTPGDVSIALGFSTGTLAVGATASFDVLLSDDGSSLGNFSITQNDPVFTSDFLTVSGIAVPEPSTWALLTVGGTITLISRARRSRRARLQA